MGCQRDGNTGWKHQTWAEFRFHENKERKKHHGLTLTFLMTGAWNCILILYCYHVMRLYVILEF